MLKDREIKEWERQRQRESGEIERGKKERLRKKCLEVFNQRHRKTQKDRERQRKTEKDRDRQRKTGIERDRERKERNEYA